MTHDEARTPTVGTEAPGRPLGLPAAVALVVFAAVLHVGDLDGPFTDGQRGNCGAMFAIFARNAQALGWSATWGVPVVNPVPPPAVDGAIFYTHHPPGLPWLVQLAAAVAPGVELGARVVAWLLTIASALLAADLMARTSGRAAGLVAGLLVLGLPAGHHHGLLVNYETAAMPGMLLLVRTLVLGRGSPGVAGAGSALLDIGALWPLAFGWIARPRGRWARATAAAVTVLVGIALLHRARAPSSLAETVQQALATTPLAADFDLGAWIHAAATFGPALFGVGLLLGPLGLVLTDRALRRPLLLLGASGLANVVVFGRHAIGHEHFWMLLLPFVALGSAAVLVPSRARRGRRRLGLVLAALALALSAAQVADERAARQRTTQAERAAAFAAVSDLETLHVFPGGVPFVFLHAAERHVVAQRIDDAAGARRAAATYRALVGGGPERLTVVVPAGDVAPSWVEALGPGTRRGEFVFRDLSD